MSAFDYALGSPCTMHCILGFLFARIGMAEQGPVADLDLDTIAHSIPILPCEACLES